MRCSNFTTKAWFTYISKRQSDFVILRAFNFHESSHLWSFVKIKPLWKFPNLQYHTIWIDGWSSHTLALFLKLSRLSSLACFSWCRTLAIFICIIQEIAITPAAHFLRLYSRYMLRSRYIFQVAWIFAEATSRPFGPRNRLPWNRYFFSNKHDVFNLITALCA